MKSYRRELVGLIELIVGIMTNESEGSDPTVVHFNPMKILILDFSRA